MSLVALDIVYRDIVSAVFGVVTPIKFVDIDLGQLKKTGELIPIEYPAMIIRFENVFWKEYTSEKQLGLVHVRLKIIYPYINEEEYYTTVHGVRDEVGIFFQIIQDIHTAIKGIGPTNHSVLERFNENHIDSKPEEMKWIYCLDYYCNIYSDSSDIEDGGYTVSIDYDLLERNNRVFERTVDVKKVG